MQEELKTRPIPNWLMAEKLTFNLENILQDSLYYPCSGFDGAPIKYFAGNVHSFIYADYGRSQERFLISLQQGLRGYHLLHYEAINQKQLSPRDWKILVHPDQEELEKMHSYRSFMKKPFAYWAVFERSPIFPASHGPERISFVHICGDGAFTYQALYLQNKIVPAILAVIQPGHGFGGNYTNYYDNQKLFYRSVIFKDEAEYYPDIFVTNTMFHDWNKHQNLLKKINSRNRLKIWELDKNIQDKKSNTSRS